MNFFKRHVRQTRSSILALAGAAAISALTACSGGSGTISASTADGSSGDGTSTTLSITKFQGVTSSSWIVETSTDALQTTSQNVAFEGTCSRGISTIKVRYKLQAAGSYTDSGVTAACDNQVFSWSKTSAGTDGTYDFQVYGVNAFGAELTESQYQRKVRIDTTAPAAPTAITVNGTSVANGGTFTLSGSGTAAIAGTIDTDVKTVTSTDSAGSFNSSDYTGIGSFTFNTTINGGESRQITFKSYDALSNTSGSYTITVTFVPTLSQLDYYVNFNTGIVLNTVTSAGVTLVRAGVESFDSAPTASGATTFTAGRAAYMAQIE